MAAIKKDPSSKKYLELDLGFLYGIPSPVKDEELDHWIPKLKSTLNRSEKNMEAAKLLNQLLAHLSSLEGQKLLLAKTWSGFADSRQKYLRDSIDQTLNQLATEYPLGVVDEDSLLSRLPAMGIKGVTPLSIKQKADSHGLTVTPALDLSKNQLPEKLVPIWNAVSKHPDYPTIFDLILIHRTDDLKSIELLDSFSANGRPITLQDIEKARRRSEQGRDTDALQDAQKFLGAVKDAAADEKALQSTVIAAIVETVTAQLQRGNTLVGVRDSLVANGIKQLDASRIVHAVSEQRSGASGSKLSLESAREKFASGFLEEAKRIVLAVGETSENKAEYAALIKQIDGALDQKEQYVAEFRDAKSKGDYATASKAIEAALGLDRGDESLEDLRDSVPPVSPSRIRVWGEDGAVVITWNPSVGSDVTYTVVRQDRRIPSDILDGKKYEIPAGQNSFRDENPPAGSSLGYAVFAQKPKSAPSEAAGATILFVPPPLDVEVRNGLTDVAFQWALPQSAAGLVIDLTGADGSSLQREVNDKSRIAIDGLTTGVRYEARLRAKYIVNGRVEYSPPVVRTVTPRAQATPVDDLEIEASQTSDGVKILRAYWTGPSGFEVQLWKVPPEFEMPSGSETTANQLVDIGGQRLQAQAGLTSTDGSQFFLAPGGFNRIVALTVTDSGLLVGSNVIQGWVDPPENVHAERYGDDVKISWNWSRNDAKVDVSWVVDGIPRTRTFTHARYRRDGGANLKNADLITDVELRTIVSIEGEQWSSPKVSVPLEKVAHPPVLQYAVRLKKRLFGNTVAHVKIEGQGELETLEVAVVVKRGRYIPLSIDDGRVIAHETLEFSGGSASFEVELPKVDSPYTFAIFPVEQSGIDVMPRDPSELKG
ncbi:hypothetical protein HMPREF1628_04515 [Actinomyces sp. S4-C9]|nr:hypothetical protein HMPREF1628_04515 [Actinomyces sp. S4-C9]